MFGATVAKAFSTRKWKFPNTMMTFSSSSSSSSSSCHILNMAARDGELRVFLVAGEVSGDSIASRLMASLKLISPFPVRFSGIGGVKMRSEGLQSLFPIEDISVMGIWELLPHLYRFRVRLNEAVQAAALFEPHVVLTVDSKGFSFRFLKQLRGTTTSEPTLLEKTVGDLLFSGILDANGGMSFAARHRRHKLHAPAHFHYVAPSFWAWKGGEARLRGLAEFVDHLLCILPNEDKICRLNGLSATFVGHPVLEDVLELNLRSNSSIDEWKAEGNGEDFCSKHDVPPGATVISLLPGSRVQEVRRMLPIFADTMELLKDTVPQLMTVIHVAPNEHVENFIAGAVQRWPVPVVPIPGGTTRLRYDALSASRVALCTSGTVAVEMQLARLPCVVAYRAHILTEWFIRYKAKIQYISLPNILLDSAIIPEALFKSCNPGYLALLLNDLIHDHGCREEQIIAAEKFVKLLLPSEKIKNNLPQPKLRTYPEYTPSVVAALTILNYEKPS